VRHEDQPVAHQERSGDGSSGGHGDRIGAALAEAGMAVSYARDGAARSYLNSWCGNDVDRPWVVWCVVGGGQGLQRRPARCRRIPRCHRPRVWHCLSALPRTGLDVRRRVGCCRHHAQTSRPHGGSACLISCPVVRFSEFPAVAGLCSRRGARAAGVDGRA